jgi:hypothetical protein
VTIHLKTAPNATLQYGLITEEVAKVYPELVARDRVMGRIDGVRYDELAPMLLNEVQKQKKVSVAQAAINAEQAKRLAAQGAQLRGMQKQSG